MRKKGLSILLALAVVLSLAPATVLADGETTLSFGNLSTMPSIVDDTKIRLEDLGNFTIPETAKSHKLEVSGTANYVSGWEKFNSTVSREQEGHYLPIRISLPDLQSYGAMTITGSNGSNKTISGFKQEDHSVELIMRLDDICATGSKSFTIKYKDETAYTIDCSQIVLKEKKPTLTFAISDENDIWGKTVAQLFTAPTAGVPVSPPTADSVVNVTGSAKEISGWTEFSSIPSDQNGNYLPLKIVPSEAGCTVTVTGVKEKVFQNWPAAGDTLVMRLNDLRTGGKREFTVKVQKGNAETVYKINFSGVTLEGVVTHKVTFSVGTGVTAIPEQEVDHNGTATKPATDPEREGYTFDGWYQDKEYTKEFDFTAGITADTTIYAHWTQNSSSDPEEESYAIRIASGIRHGDVYTSHWYAEPGEWVTVTVYPDSDYEVDWVEVERSDGRLLWTDRSGNRYTFRMPASNVTVDARFTLRYGYRYTRYTVYIPEEPVEKVNIPSVSPVTWRPAAALWDVPSYSGSYPAAQWAYQNGYLDTAADGTLRLDAPVTHQQMWKIMAHWMGTPVTDARSITNWALQNGAAGGKPASAAMTRQNVVEYLYRCYFQLGGDVSVTGNLSGYRDSQLITSAASQNAWLWAVNKGIISGTADGYLNPDAVISRGDFAAVLMRLCQNVMG